MASFTDKERILTQIINQLYFTVQLRVQPQEDLSDYAHFEPVKQDCSNLRKNDCVIGITANVHRWKIGFVDSWVDAHTMTIREIGSNKLCNVWNEGFSIIRGMDKGRMLDCHKYRFQRKVKKAMYRLDGFSHLFHRIDFHDPNEAIMWVRERFGGFHGVDGKRSVPYMIPIHWTSKTTITEIMDKLEEFCFSEREFEVTDLDYDWKTRLVQAK
jgi:hypothetical protein